MKKLLLTIISLLLLTNCTPPQNQNNQITDRIIKKQTTPTLEAAKLEPIKNVSFETSKKKEKIIKFKEGKLPTLMFHYIQDIPPTTQDQLGYKLSFSPQKLEQLLIYFQENDITPITFKDLQSNLEGKFNLPKKPVILTFDDGHKDHYTNAFPLLKKYNMKATFFIISNKPDNDPNFATWEQIKEIATDGHEIASHTVSHLNLTTLSNAQLEKELNNSKQLIQKKIGKPIITLCYPAGRYNNQIIEAVKKHYNFARTTKPGDIFSENKKHEIPTIRIHPTTTTKSIAKLFK